LEYLGEGGWSTWERGVRVPERDGSECQEPAEAKRAAVSRSTIRPKYGGKVRASKQGLEYLRKGVGVPETGGWST
jgi:hypothetical protein